MKLMKAAVLESSVLGCALFTAYGAVRHGADLRGGERIAVVATGGVGVNVIQIAHAFGASQIIAIDVSDDKLEMARRVGATDVVDARTTNAADRVRELTDGRGVDIARGTFRPEKTVTRRFPLALADAAYKALDRGEILGRAIVTT